MPANPITRRRLSLLEGSPIGRGGTLHQKPNVEGRSPSGRNDTPKPDSENDSRAETVARSRLRSRGGRLRSVEDLPGGGGVHEGGAEPLIPHVRGDLADDG